MPFRRPLGLLAFIFTSRSLSRLRALSDSDRDAMMALPADRVFDVTTMEPSGSIFLCPPARPVNDDGVPSERCHKLDTST